MQNGGNSTDPSGYGGGGGNSNSGRTHVDTITPVTVKQIQDAAVEPTAGKLLINNATVEQVTLVTRIVEATMETTVILLVFDDCTGAINGTFMLPPDDGSGNHELAVQKRQAAKQGVWARVTGVIETTAEGRKISVYKLRAVEDFNEIIYHRLEVVNVFLELTRPRPIASQVMPQPSSSAARPNHSGLHDQVLEYIKARHDAKSDGNQGVSIGDVCRDVGGALDNVREVLEGLATDGHVYTTVDDNHFVYCAQ